MNITCDGSATDCSSGIDCPQQGECRVYCTNDNCAGATITCPLNGDCYVQCGRDTDSTLGTGTCEGATINATYQNGNFELLCDDPNDGDDTTGYDEICRNIEVLGSTLNTNIGTSFLVTCGRDSNSCRDATINCAQGMDCEVDCHPRDHDYATNTFGGGSIRACRDATIYGPTGYALRVECEDNLACQSAIIRGESSSSLNMTCFDTKACEDVTIYCPENTNGTKNCLLTGVQTLHLSCSRHKILKVSNNTIR